MAATSRSTSVPGWTPSNAYAAPAPGNGGFWQGLGTRRKDQLRPSPGILWRLAHARTSAGGVLFSNAPDLLLLDEPTNYLDLEGVLWLENFLQRYRGTILIVSHDRDLLNTAAEFIPHLEKGKMTLYTGGYDNFVTPPAPPSAPSTTPSPRSGKLDEKTHAVL